MKKCLIIINTFKEESGLLGKSVADFLEKRGVQASFLEFNGFSENYPFKGYDFLVTLGGDGTVLYACRGCAPLGIPVFPVNLGEFGFIAGIQKDEWEYPLTMLLEEKMKFERRSMLCAEVFREDERILCFSALNDIVVSAQTAARSISLDIDCMTAPLGSFKADGIIVATPTGSTAYSASAGGPIISPDLDAMVLTPLNPFSLSARPLVVSSRAEFEIAIAPSRNHDVIITADGQKFQNLCEGDVIKIKKSPDDAIIVGSTPDKFFNALRFKLNWSGGPHA